MTKKNKVNDPIAPVTEVDASPEAEYRAIVEECKTANADISMRQWVLGDAALKVEKRYGENRIKQFAEDVNFHGNYCTLERYRPVCRAFPQTGVRPRFFASAHVLQTHPDRIEIVTANPDISKAEARELMRQWRAATETEAEAEDDDLFEDEDEAEAEPGPTPTATPTSAKTKGSKKTADADEWAGNSKRWQSEVVVVANNAIDLAEVRKRCTPDQRRDLLAVLEAAHIETVRKASEALAELAAWLRKLLDEAADTAIREGRVRTSPKPPQEPRAGT